MLLWSIVVKNISRKKNILIEFIKLGDTMMMKANDGIDKMYIWHIVSSPAHIYKHNVMEILPIRFLVSSPKVL